MTGRAVDACLIMRRMLEFYVRARREPVNPYPRDFNILVGVSDDFLHFRLFLAQFGVAEHALSHRRNACGGANVSADMAIDALQSKPHVRIVRELNRLLGSNSTQRCKPHAHRDVPDRPRDLRVKQFCIFSEPLVVSEGTTLLFVLPPSSNADSCRTPGGTRTRSFA